MGRKGGKGKAAAKGGQLEQERPQAIQEILADLRCMHNNPEFSDVTFVCRDGVRVPACRLFLAARSSFLRPMLTNGMAESRMSEIALPEMSSPVLNCVFEFLYTGAVVSLSWRRALELVMAARYFLLDSLEAAAWAFLTTTASQAGEAAAAEAAERLSAALEFHALWDASRSGILSDLSTSLNSLCGDSAHLHFRALSGEALRFFLDKDDRIENVGMFSFAEYLRLRLVILWCAHQLVPPRDDFVSGSLPVAKSLCAVLEAPEEIDVGQEARLDDDLRENLARALEPWLLMVNFRRLHPTLFVKVVEPLSILPAPLLLEVFRFHALQRTRELGDHLCCWDTDAHGEGYATSGRTCVKIGYDCGIARGNMAMSRPGLYQWDVVVDEVNDNFCDVGIISATSTGATIDYDSDNLSRHLCGRALAICDAGTFIAYVEEKEPQLWGGNHPTYIPYGKPYGHKNARVRVHLDLFERTCSFSVDHEKFGVAWDNLPDAIYYPAVSLGRAEDRVHIELVSGAEFL